MGIVEVISAVLLIASGIFMIIITLLQESKKGIGGVLTGGSSDNYFQKNAERTKEAKLKRLTKTAALLLFLVIIFANVAEAYTPKGENWLGGVFNSSSEESTSDPAATASVTDAEE